MLENGKAGGKFELDTVRSKYLEILVYSTFQTRNPRIEARIAPNCRTAGVSHSNLRPKTAVSMFWKAPETGTDCVDFKVCPFSSAKKTVCVFKASIIQSKSIWYAAEGELQKRLCIVG